MLKTLSKSICAGILISIGGSVFLACDRYIGAALFSVALLCICYLDYYLFTGKIGFFADHFNGTYLRELLTGLSGNLLTVFLLGLVIRYALPSLGAAAAPVFAGKLEQSFAQALVRSAFCGVLMYLAVAVFRDGKNPIGILFCIPVFILSGFEHSIADMFYFGASGCTDVRAAAFLLTVVLGNTVGSLLLPLLSRIGGKNENKP